MRSREKTPKTILNNVSGSARSGEILTIMGSSGAGKSTLLNVLAKRNLKRIVVNGSIKFDGDNFEGKVLRPTYIIIFFTYIICCKELIRVRFSEFMV